MRLIVSAFLFAAVLQTISAPSYAQDAARGEKLFRRCMTCHTITDGGPNKVGPNLFGIVGRDIATRDGFRYSNALLALEGTWTEAALNQYLLSPRTYARGTRMAFAGLRKSKERADMIAWLKSQSPTKETGFEEAVKEPRQEPENVDPDLALLPKGAGRQETYEGCASCHSIKLVVQQGMNKDEWVETIEWMVDEQGMDPIADDLNALITDYLAIHFGRDRPNFPK